VVLSLVGVRESVLRASPCAAVLRGSLGKNNLKNNSHVPKCKWHDAEFVWIASGLRGRLGGIAERGPIHATAATRVFVHLVRRGLVHRQ
jgi:hypothetical protein